MSSFEIEIKSLLGEKKYADCLVRNMETFDPNTKLVAESRQLNHYFVNGQIHELYSNASSLFEKNLLKELKKIVDKGSDFSVRTREINGDVRLVLKASIGDDSSANGVSRMEFDEKVEGRSLSELDQLFLDSGYEYQAKWSRERKEYTCNNISVCVDKNAGYGYLAEFEKVVNESSLVKEIENELREFMNKLECEELAQDRLERMFSHYNENWPEYYGTEKVFVIK
jgi:adenylate cyclase class IV